MGWQETFRDELVAAGIPDHEARQLAGAAVAEAIAGRQEPADLYGPAVIHAREVAAALREEEPARAGDQFPPGPADVLLRVTGLHVTRGHREVLRGVDLEVHRGELVAVVGANGSGKSTLLQTCAGLLKPTRGTIERVEDFGYAPQSMVQAPLLSVDEHLRLFGAARGVDPGRATTTGHRILHRLGWQANGRQLVGTLSGGTQQKVNLALAQLHSPSLLLLDEPYQGFDALAYDDLWQLVSTWRRAGAGILMITHLLRDTLHVDRVLELPSPETSHP